MSPDGSQVFVTGSADQFANEKSITVAYDATLQTQQWVATYHHLNGHGDGTDAIGVSPDGTRVFVTGWTADQGLSRDLTIAYRATDGHTFWRKAYTNGDDGLADALAVSPDGNVAYVSGAGGSLSDSGFLTVAYSALTGARVWAKAYDGPGGGFDRVYDMVLSPSGAEMFVTGAALAPLRATGTTPPSPTRPLTASRSGPSATTGTGRRPPTASR